MFTISVKGKENPKDEQMVKLEMIFFKTGYARVTKVLNVSGEFKEWDNDTQKFKPRTSEALDKNRRIIELKTSYLKIAKEWEDSDDAWTPVEWSHCFDEQTKKINDVKVCNTHSLHGTGRDAYRSPKHLSGYSLIREQNRIL